jgi:hypothetical protein
VFCEDTSALSNFVNSLIALKPQRLLMSHGGIIQGTEAVKNALEKALSRVVGVVTQRWGVTKAFISFLGKFT